MREAAEEMEDSMVDKRKEDKAINSFKIPMQEDISGVLLRINSVHIMRDGEVEVQAVAVELRRDDHLLLAGPNGIGKSTLLQKIVSGEEDGVELTP